MFFDDSNSLAPLPIRVIFGIYFILTGYLKLFSSDGHANIVSQLDRLQIPLPQVVSWGVGIIAFVGGLLLLIGLFTTVASWLNIFSTGGHALLALITGGLPAGNFPAAELEGWLYEIPAFGFSLLLLGGLATLIIGGAGAYSVDRWLADPQPKLREFQFTDEQKADIQGIILSGYSHLDFGHYLFLEFKDRAKAKAWIRAITPDIASSKNYDFEEMSVDKPLADVQAAQAWLLRKYPKRFEEAKDVESRAGRAFVTEESHPDALGQITIKKAEQAVKIKWKPSIRINVAFTYGGFAALGLPEKTLLSFTQEFIQDMPTSARLLGDIGASAPEYWELGGLGRCIENGEIKEKHANDNPPIHAIVMLAGLDQRTIDTHLAEQKRLIAQSGGGVVIVKEQGGSRPKGQQEPFGFHDGISNPLIQGKPGHPTANRWVIKTGDAVLGYLNEYDLFSPSPLVSVNEDPDNILPAFPEGQLQKFHDLGRNGTYMVYRKLEQDVPGFWRYINGQAESPDGAPATDHETIKLASKCVGRWPSGAPMVLTPDYDDVPLWKNDFFTYMPTDPHGFGCPIGSHIRRTNPRDSRIHETAEESFTTVNQHRITRRAVSFGPLHPFDPTDLERGVVPPGVYKPTKPRGIHFFALNVDIARQFELVQHTWASEPRFNALFNNRDPLIGDNDPTEDRLHGSLCEKPHLLAKPIGQGPGYMAIPRDPLRRRMLAIPRFVSVQGGAYFFMPSIIALRFLAHGAPDNSGNSGTSPTPKKK